MKKITLFLSLVLCFCMGANAQNLGGKLKEAAKKAAAQALNEATGNNKSGNSSSNNGNHNGNNNGNSAKPAMTSGNSGKSVTPDLRNAIYVSSETGSNRNDGSKGAPYKNLQKAIEQASAGATILVAQGNYYGILNKGNINIDKPVKIFGGYSSDFSTRDVLKYRTFVQPDNASNGTQNGQGTMQIKINDANAVVVVDGLLFDRGNAIAYNKKGEGKPEGVESPMMNPIGVVGFGGPNLKDDTYTTETAEIYFDNPTVGNIIINNCAFVNAPNYAIRGMLNGTATITNNIFVNVRMAAVEIPGSSAAKNSTVNFSYNTVLFCWARLKDMGDMGYGYRYMNGTNSYLDHNIFGCCTFSALDRCRVESSKDREAKKVTTAEHNIFFLNKQADITLPGGGLFLRVWVRDFDDVEQLAKVAGNKALTDPKEFNGAIDEAYLKGFIEASYKENTTYDPNSAANTFRAAMGMNQVGTMTSSASMYANRYPVETAFRLFGAINGYGAQKIK